MPDNNTTNSTFLAAGLAYAARGWAVFPCWGIIDGRCACPAGSICKNPGKHPATANGFHDATTDEAQIRRWWSENPSANIAVATGRVSGIVVIDLDVKNGKDGVSEFAKLGPMPPTLTARSGSGGRHIFVQHPGGTVSSSSDKLGRGIDVRADGAYILVAPSRHISGGRYAWE